MGVWVVTMRDRSRNLIGKSFRRVRLPRAARLRSIHVSSGIEFLDDCAFVHVAVRISGPVDLDFGPTPSSTYPMQVPTASAVSRELGAATFRYDALSVAYTEPPAPSRVSNLEWQAAAPEMRAQLRPAVHALPRIGTRSQDALLGILGVREAQLAQADVANADDDERHGHARLRSPSDAGDLPIIEQHGEEACALTFEECIEMQVPLDAPMPRRCARQRACSAPHTCACGATPDVIPLSCRLAPCASAHSAH